MVRLKHRRSIDLEVLSTFHFPFSTSFCPAEASIVFHELLYYIRYFNTLIHSCQHPLSKVRHRKVTFCKHIFLHYYTCSKTETSTNHKGTLPVEPTMSDRDKGKGKKQEKTQPQVRSPAKTGQSSRHGSKPTSPTKYTEVDLFATARSPGDLLPGDELEEWRTSDSYKTPQSTPQPTSRSAGKRPSKPSEGVRREISKEPPPSFELSKLGSQSSPTEVSRSSTIQATVGLNPLETRRNVSGWSTEARPGDIDQEITEELPGLQKLAEGDTAPQTTAVGYSAGSPTKRTAGRRMHPPKSPTKAKGPTTPKGPREQPKEVPSSPSKSSRATGQAGLETLSKGGPVGPREQPKQPKTPTRAQPAQSSTDIPLRTQPLGPRPPPEAPQQYDRDREVMVPQSRLDRGQTAGRQTQSDEDDDGCCGRCSS
jgi:hypothetical protein